MWLNSITGKKTSIRKSTLNRFLALTDKVEVRTSITGDSPNKVEIFLSHLRKVSGRERSETIEKTMRFGSTSYVASVGTCHVISKSATIGYENKTNSGGFWRPFVC